MSSQAAGLHYAVRLGVIAKYVGQLGLVLATLTLVPALVALLLGEFDHALAFVPPLLVLLLGWALTHRLPPPSQVQINEGMIVVALLFLLAPLLMCYPLMQMGLSLPDALFEAISAVTTTGITSLPSQQGLPESFLFGRAWMQWYGGLGIVVLSLALLIPPGTVAKGLAVNEAEADNLVGGMRAHARHILLIYLGLTVGALLLNRLANLDGFDSLLLSLSAVSTGGFAPGDDSLATLVWPAQWTVSLGCLAGAIPLTLYYGRGEEQAGNRLQLAALLLFIVVLALLLALRLHLDNGLSWRQAFHHAPLLAISAQTTAGFSSLDPAALSNGSKVLLILAMLAGGGVASTAGGIKLLRLLIAWSALRQFLRRSSLPRHAVLEPSLAGRRLPNEEIHAALLLILLFALLVLLSWLPFVLQGYPPLDALFEVVSACGTVGLSSGLSQSDLPGLLRGILALDMLMGRLEILAWLVLCYPGSWIGRRREV